MSDPIASSTDDELRSHVERVLASQYELDQEIGRGGMGVVYKGKDRRLKRTVAIKLLPPEMAFRAEIRSRFLREAETAAQLSHPNIVPIYGVDEKDGLVYFVMGFVDGENLAVRLHNNGPLDVEEVRRVLREVADALAYAHSRGVIHRDIKPDNILLDKENDRAMVTDFGIARAYAADTRLTATGMAIGTPAYMSPEQAAGEREIDGRSDLYSLGVVGYQLLTGELPFNAGTTAAMLVKHLSERPAPIEQRRAGVPPDLNRAVMLMLEKDPADRFPDAKSLLTALDNRNAPALPVRAPTQSAVAQPANGMNVAPWNGAATASRHYEDSLERAPTPDELARWNAPLVDSYRKKLGRFLLVNMVLVPVGIIFNSGLLTFSVFWTVYMAWQYAKLWTEGYDWRDVFRQPRDRLFFDVAAESIDDARALFDHDKRAELRVKYRSRRRTSLFDHSSPPAALPAPQVASLAGQHAGVVQQAANDRDEILRLVDTMPRSDRDQLGDVVGSARALSDRVQSLAFSLAELDRTAVPTTAAQIEQEITALEAQANPLDHRASEERVRRLAYLKRQRRSVADLGKRREQIAAKLESCRLALQTMRFDVLRLRTGGQTYQHVTLMAEQAMALARDVDNAIYVHDEVARLTGRRSEGRPIPGQV